MRWLTGGLCSPSRELLQRAARFGDQAPLKRALALWDSGVRNPRQAEVPALRGGPPDAVKRSRRACDGEVVVDGSLVASAVIALHVDVVDAVGQEDVDQDAAAKRAPSSGGRGRVAVDGSAAAAACASRVGVPDGDQAEVVIAGDRVEAGPVVGAKEPREQRVGVAVGEHRTPAAVRECVARAAGAAEDGEAREQQPVDGAAGAGGPHPSLGRRERDRPIGGERDWRSPA